jgi:hypothetical protein
VPLGFLWRICCGAALVGHVVEEMSDPTTCEIYQRAEYEVMLRGPAKPEIDLR